MLNCVIWKSTNTTDTIVCNNSNSHSAAVGNKKLSKFVPILFYWCIFHTCAHTSAKHENWARRGVRRAVPGHAINVMRVHLVRDGLVLNLLWLFLCAKEIAKLMQSRSISIVCITHWLCAMHVRRAISTNIDLSTINKTDFYFSHLFPPVGFILFFFFLVFELQVRDDAIKRSSYDKLQIYECWMRGNSFVWHFELFLFSCFVPFRLRLTETLMQQTSNATQKEMQIE